MAFLSQWDTRRCFCAICRAGRASSLARSEAISWGDRKVMPNPLLGKKPAYFGLTQEAQSAYPYAVGLRGALPNLRGLQPFVGKLSVKFRRRTLP